MNFINNLDNRIYELLTKTQNITITQIMIIISFLASTVTLIGLTITLVIILKNKNYSKYIVLNLALSFIINNLIKIIIKRPRPHRIQIIQENGYSFPSGHAMISFAFYGFLIYLLYTNIKNKKIKYTSIALLSLLILFIGISRIYLGIHYVTDVIGGFIIGFIYLIIFIKYIK